VKINAVLQRGVNESSALDLVERFRHSGCTVRFIEFMDVGTLNQWRREQVVPAREMLARIAARWPLHPVAPAYRGEVAAYYAFDDGGGEVGFITSVTQPFCGDCSRMRLSAEGSIYTCLFAHEGTDLREMLRGGASDEEIAGRLAGIWNAREDRYSESRAGTPEVLRKVEMFHIGG
jgi:cyclic pyranopterin phosphate synthase